MIKNLKWFLIIREFIILYDKKVRYRKNLDFINLVFKNILKVLGYIYF